jgi:isopentenyldiphosphate isomerase
MEYLDTYDEYGNFIKKEEREKVHEDGLWHKTVHCWLYDKDGNIYFQIRTDSHKLYTTASGHVLAGESIKEGFAREIKEELGIDNDTSNAEMVEINVWKMDKVKNDKVIKDRAFANVYISEFNGDMKNFNIDKNELEGIVKVKSDDALRILKQEQGTCDCEKYIEGKVIKDKLNFSDFLIFNKEIGIIKYGKILQRVIAVTSE